MYDPNRDQSLLTPLVQWKLVRALAECFENGCDVRMSEWFRSDDRQKFLLGHGRTERALIDFQLSASDAALYADPTKSRVTRVRKSNHQYGIAVDIYFNIPGDIYRDSKRPLVSQIFIKNWFQRGFDMRGVDKPHFECNWLTTTETELEQEDIWYYKSIFLAENPIGSETLIKDIEWSIDRLAKLWAIDRKHISEDQYLMNIWLQRAVRGF